VSQSEALWFVVKTAKTDGPYTQQQLVELWEQGSLEPSDRLRGPDGVETLARDWHRQMRLDQLDAAELAQGLNQKRPRPRIATSELNRTSPGRLEPSPLPDLSSSEPAASKTWIWAVGAVVLLAVGWVVSSGVFSTEPKLKTEGAASAGVVAPVDNPARPRPDLRPRVDPSAIRIPPRREAPRQETPIPSDSNPVTYPEILPEPAPESPPSEPNPDAEIGEIPPAEAPPSDVNPDESSPPVEDSPKDD
jgi:hypothetical protein